MWEPLKIIGLLLLFLLSGTAVEMFLLTSRRRRYQRIYPRLYCEQTLEHVQEAPVRFTEEKRRIDLDRSGFREAVDDSPGKGVNVMPSG